MVPKGPFKCYVTLLSWEFDPHPPHHNEQRWTLHLCNAFFRESWHPTPHGVTVTLERPLISRKNHYVRLEWPLSDMAGLRLSYIISRSRGAGLFHRFNPPPQVQTMDRDVITGCLKVKLGHSPQGVVNGVAAQGKQTLHSIMKPLCNLTTEGTQWPRWCD